MISLSLSNLWAKCKGAAAAAFLLMLLLAALPFSVPAAAASSEGGTVPTVSSELVSVQALIDSAQPGDTIHVPAGYYYGQVNITKTLRLFGENSSTTILDGNQSGDVVSVTANDVEICGFTIQNSSSRGIGVNFENCTGGYIHDNVMKNSYEGLVVGGCSDTLVSANRITSNFGNLGVMINYSTSVTFHRNIVTRNIGQGLVVYHCSNCVVSENQLVENDDKSVVWAVGMVLSNSQGVVISGNNITGNAYHGLNLVSCHDNAVFNNTMRRNVNGICLSGAPNNVVYQNIVKDNENGAAFYGVSNNNIYHNDFLRNTRQVFTFFGTEVNKFDNGYPSGGNFWSDYNGTDTNQDGIGDTPYIINANNSDRYPLIYPFNTPDKVQTTASISIQPNPAGIGQTAFINMTLSPPPPTPSDRFDVIVLTITRPDGTILMRGPFFSDSNGQLCTEYMPDLVGNYTLQLNYPGQFFPSHNVTYLGTQSPAITFFVQSKVAPKTWTVDDDAPADFPIIQEAIDAASYGDIVFVRAGTYQENLVIGKPLSLIGENAPQTIISNKTSGKVIIVNASRVTIANFTIKGIGGTLPQPYNLGIYFVSPVTNCNISNNIITGHGYGISLRGSQNTVENNHVFANSASGIYLNATSNNAIKRNTVVGPGKTGIFITWPSSNNVLRDNNMTGSELNLHVIGYDIPGFTNDIDTSNTVNGKPIYYWINKANQVVPSDAATVYLINCVNITVQNLQLSFTGQGVLLAYTSGSTIQGNSITNCDNGIRVQSSSNNLIIGNDFYGCQAGVAFYMASDNTVRNNTIGASTNNGAFVFLSSGNKFFYNTFNNKKQAWVDSNANTWDNGYPAGGNYWSDYGGTDANGDGIGDTPYAISGNNTDRYPLVKTAVQSNSSSNTTTSAAVREEKTSTATPSPQSQEQAAPPPQEVVPIEEEPATTPEAVDSPFSQVDHGISLGAVLIAVFLASAVGIAFLGSLRLLRGKR